MMLMFTPTTSSRLFSTTTSAAAFENRASSLLSGHCKGTGEVVRKRNLIPYIEESEFKVIGASPQAVVYRTVSYTEHAQRGTPMHTENGFIKVLNNDVNDGEKLEDATVFQLRHELALVF
jgi:hypothetical protein